MATSTIAQSDEFRYEFRPPADGPVGLLERPEQPTVERPSAPLKPEGEEPGAGEKARKGFLRRRPIAAAFGLLSMAVVGAGGYLYWDDAAHFESTDDAFIAARQFTISPKVPGYLTAVPVTDNQHVAAGEVIVRIDDRDYRIAVDRAQAQVASSEASIQNIDAQIGVQNAQVNANQAQLHQAQAALVFAQQQNARYEHLAQTGWARFKMRSSTPRS
jgi:membrane fusion protein, multidrug efflux system